MTTILLADDHEIVRRGLRQVLVDGIPDVRIGEAASAAETMASLEGSAWDLVILDLNMPGRGGLEILGDVKRRRPGLPVLVVSAYPEEDFAVRSIRLGAAGYVTKSSAADELLIAARKTLGGGRYITPSLAETLASVLGGGVVQPRHETLSTRELQVVRLVALGRTAKEIAEELHLSEKTIATYRARISHKLGVSSNVELTRYALKNGLAD